MFTALQQIRNANNAWAVRERREWWFNDGAMSFFSTTFPDPLIYRGCVFITSESYSPTNPLFPTRYTLRRCLPSGRVTTVGTFQQYLTLEDAQQAAQVVELEAEE